MIIIECKSKPMSSSSGDDEKEEEQLAPVKSRRFVSSLLVDSAEDCLPSPLLTF
jgi:hypothetical protein